MKLKVGVKGPGSEGPSIPPGQSVILLCNQEGFDVCLRRQLIGVANHCASRLGPGDWVFLYHKEDRHLYGIWSVLGNIGSFDSGPWGVRHPHQVQVQRESGSLLRISHRQLVSILGTSEVSAQLLNGDKTRKLARRIQSGGKHRRRTSRDLFLVRWSVWVAVAAFILLVIFVLWGLSTHEPSQDRFNIDSD